MDPRNFGQGRPDDTLDLQFDVNDDFGGNRAESFNQIGLKTQNLK